MRRLVMALTWLTAAAWLFQGRDARAYPQWQLLSGANRCNQCHFSPSGGGLLNGYGRDASGDELSSFGGNGAFLHGAAELPDWLRLGGDFRGAFVANDVGNPDGVRRALFPMQADLQARVALPSGVSVYASVGVRGQVRRNDDLVPQYNYQPIDGSRFISREHYAMWQPQPLGPYARAGRFYAPFGLRLAEHVTYVRRDLGFNLLQETYNLSGGYVAEGWEAHVTAFAPDFLRHMGGSERGASGYAETRWVPGMALAAQVRWADGSGYARTTAGGVAKYHLAMLRTVLLAEGNLVHWTYDGVPARRQFVGGAGAAVWPVRGVLVTLLGERNQEDLGVRFAAWNAATGLVSWFPYAHVELQVMGRVQFPAGGEAAQTLLAQLHYWL